MGPRSVLPKRCPYGSVLFLTDASFLFDKRCTDCYDQNFRARGVPGSGACDGLHLFLCEIIQFQMRSESRFLVSKESTPPHPYCSLFCPGASKNGPVRYYNGKLQTLNEMPTVYDHKREVTVKHDVAFMLE